MLKSKNLTVLLNKLPVFNPDHILLITWDLIIFILAFINLLLSPLNFTFNITNQLSSYIMDLMPIFFFIDILISFNRGSLDNFCKIKDRKKIIHSYFKGQLFFDLAPTIQLLLANKINKFSIFNFIFLFRFPLIWRNKKRIQDHFHLEEKFY